MNEVPSVDSMLEADLSGVDSGFPIIEAGVVSGIVSLCARGETKENKKPVINITIKSSVPLKTTKGQTKPAGFPFRHMISLTPTFEEDGVTLKYDPRQNLKAFKEACFGDGSGSFGDPAGYVGRPVSFNIVIRSSAEYGDQNSIKSFIKPQAS